MNYNLKIKLVFYILASLSIFYINNQLFAAETIEFKDKNQLLNVC